MSEDLKSLEKSLKTASELERFDLLVKLSLGYFKISPAKALSCAEEAFAMAESKQDQSKKASALNAMGKAYLGKMNHVKALSYLHEALSIFEDIGSSIGSAEVMRNIGLLYLSTLDQENALEYFEKARELFSQLNERKLLAATLNSIGLALSNSDRNDEALSNLDEALRIAEEENDREVIRSATNNKGIILYKNGDFENAVKFFRKASILSEETGELRSLAGNLINMGTCSVKLGKLDDAHEYLMRGVETAEKSEATDFMMQGCYSLCNLFSMKNDFQKALEYHKQMYDLQQQVYTAEKSRAMAEIETRYETEKAAQEAEINRLKNIELAEKNRLIEAQAELLRQANEEISIHKEELQVKNNELERLLQEKDEFLRRMVAHISDGVIIDDPDGKIVYANDRFLNIFGLSRDDLENYEPFSTIAPEWRDKVREIHRKRVTGEMVPEILEFEGISKNGERIWLEVGSTVVESNGVIQGTQSIVRDVTERKKLEAQLLQSQRLDAVGRLAGGIAHDFNNLLTVIKGHSEFILEDLSDTHPLRTDAEEVRKATDRASSLIRQLLAFSKQQQQQPSTIDLRVVVSGLHRMLSRLLGEGIQLETEFAENAGCVLADESQIEQVIVNLAINARDAMESGGRLIIGINNVDITENSHLTNMKISPGKYVVLEVTDSGTGMTPDIQAKLFEPFFTTKAVDKGSGLGLAMAYGIIKQSNGAIDVTSEPGKGSTFSIYLPCVDGEHVRNDYQSSISERTGKGERILLVEDDSSLRRMSERFLQNEGYNVESAGSAEKAMEAVVNADKGFDMLLTDIILPGMNGFKLAEKLTEEGFKGRILYMTGYANKDIKPTALKEGARNLLEKPFSLYSLSKRVREILDSD